MIAEQEKQKKAAELLNKLLNAALIAQREGKYIALQKIIFEANRLSSKLNSAIEKERETIQQAFYKPVLGVVIE